MFGSSRYSISTIIDERSVGLPAEACCTWNVSAEFVVTLKTAKALGLEVPGQLQQLADEVIE